MSRKTTTLNVVYDGAPKFVGIAGTSLWYAVNTATPVIETSPSQFFAVANGIWFTATTANGPWHVADTVPAAIYTIPPASPVRYVTYVRVYSATPDTVVVGYTPGYLGVVVNADGTVVYGTGYVYAPYVGDVYYGYPATYGYGAGFALSTTVGFAFGFAIGATWGAGSPYWGPYWGGGPWSWQYANVNQANIYGRWGQGTVTHASGWNGWTGNSWAGTAASGFNPYTGGHFQASRGAVENAYNGNFAAGRQGSFSNPSTGRSGAARGGVVGNEATGDYAAGSRVPATTRRRAATARRKRASPAMRIQAITRRVRAASWAIRIRVRLSHGTTATCMPVAMAMCTVTIRAAAGSSTARMAGNPCSRTRARRSGSIRSSRGTTWAMRARADSFSRSGALGVEAGGSGDESGGAPVASCHRRRLR